MGVRRRALAQPKPGSPDRLDLLPLRYLLYLCDTCLPLRVPRALAFALRRLEEHRVRLVAAVRVEVLAWQRPRGPPAERPGGRHAPRAGGFAVIEASLGGRALSRLPVGPLSVASTHYVFRQVLGASFPRPVLVRIHQAAAGNPFYELEIAREVRRAGDQPARVRRGIELAECRYFAGNPGRRPAGTGTLAGHAPRR